MKILLLHGENPSDSLKRKVEVTKSSQEKGWEIMKISDKNQSLSDLILGNSLFSQKRLFVVDDFSLLKKNDLEWLSQNSDRYEDYILIHSTTKLSQTQIKSLPKSTKTEDFKVPTYIWTFLDSFFPGNAKNCIQLFEKAVSRQPVEQIFSLVVRQLSNLYLARIDASKLKLDSWRISKLRSQAMHFTQKGLRDIIKDLSRMDVEAKTSKSELKDSLDILILTKLG